MVHYNLILFISNLCQDSRHILNIETQIRNLQREEKKHSKIKDHKLSCTTSSGQEYTLTLGWYFVSM